jgi:hypothetical protein
MEERIRYVIYSRERIGVFEKIKWDMRDQILVTKKVFGEISPELLKRIEDNRVAIGGFLVELEDLQKKLQIDSMATDQENLDLFMKSSIKM